MVVDSIRTIQSVANVMSLQPFTKWLYYSVNLVHSNHDNRDTELN